MLALSLAHGTRAAGRGVELGAPANPAEDFGAARPEWSFRGLYQLRDLLCDRAKLPNIVPIFVIPTLVVLVLGAMPLVAKWAPVRR